MQLRTLSLITFLCAVAGTTTAMADTNTPIKATLALAMPEIKVRMTGAENTPVALSLSTPRPRNQTLSRDRISMWEKDHSDDPEEKVKLPELIETPKEEGLGTSEFFGGRLKLDQGPLTFFEANPDYTRVTPNGEPLNPPINWRFNFKKITFSRFRGLTYFFSKRAEVSLMEEKYFTTSGFGLMMLFTWYDE